MNNWTGTICPLTNLRPKLDQAKTATVLANLDANPGETTNVIELPADSKALKQAR